MDRPEKRRTVVLAGASGGIGAALARHLHAKGDHVIAACRTPPPCGDWVAADLLAPAGLDAVAEKVADLALDALVVAAGTWETGAFTPAYDFARGPEADIDRVVALNATMPIKLVRRLLPALRRAAVPRVVLVGALSGRDHCATREVANSASKYALRGAAQALRLETPDIAVTVLNPGNVATAEVEADIRDGRFSAQKPIPIADLAASLDYALGLSAASVALEIDLAQTAP